MILHQTPRRPRKRHDEHESFQDEGLTYPDLDQLGLSIPPPLLLGGLALGERAVARASGPRVPYQTALTLGDVTAK